ncbi:MAG: CT583 family protein [Candidatus Rhabdochlamydia sp.]
MAKINSLLSQRLKTASEKLSKMTNLVELSSNGNLSSFAGVFRVTALNEIEIQTLEKILNQYKNENQEVIQDLDYLASLTAEVKAINNQAIILHGERIKKAQHILTNYQEGAFSAWLVCTYGNRQTPYNFLQYYELYSAIPPSLHPQLDLIPRQAAYSLASRQGSLLQKQQIIKTYQGQSKQELLELIRITFPLSIKDKRAQDIANVAILDLKKTLTKITKPTFCPTAKQRQQLLTLLKQLKISVESSHD